MIKCRSLAEFRGLKFCFDVLKEYNQTRTEVQVDSLLAVLADSTSYLMNDNHQLTHDLLKEKQTQLTLKDIDILKPTEISTTLSAQDETEFYHGVQNWLQK